MHASVQAFLVYSMSVNCVRQHTWARAAYNHSYVCLLQAGLSDLLGLAGTGNIQASLIIEPIAVCSAVDCKCIL